MGWFRRKIWKNGDVGKKNDGRAYIGKDDVAEGGLM
jgi:hypothetical protein